MATKLTKAQLLARIDELELSLDVAVEQNKRLDAENATLYAEQRPSRSLPKAVTQGRSPVVAIAGRQYTYSIAIEGGRRVKTYHPWNGGAS